MAVINIRFMGLKATAVWKPHPVWPAPINVSSAGGRYKKQYRTIVSYATELLISLKLYIDV